MEQSREEILKRLQEIRESMTEEQIKNASGDDLVNYLMEVHKLETLLMTAIDEFSRENK